VGLLIAALCGRKLFKSLKGDPSEKRKQQGQTFEMKRQAGNMYDELDDDNINVD